MKEKKYKKSRITLYVVLRVLVIATMVTQFFHKNYANVFLCFLTLALFFIPTIIDRRFNIKLPSALEVIILLFIFAAEILGEIQSFYVVFKHWDTMLHTINGFLMAAIGFAMIDVLNEHPRFHINMSPIFVGFVAFCFSMTIGVIWEFFEFSMDYFFITDMQKDFIVQTVSSVALNPDGVNTPVIIKNITGTVINSVQNGQPVQTVIEGGYLDIGIIDTMKDLLVNFIGAFIFSVIGIFYVKGKGKIAAKFIPRLKTKEEILADEKERTDYISKKLN